MQSSFSGVKLTRDINLEGDSNPLASYCRGENFYCLKKVLDGKLLFSADDGATGHV